jgi:DNA repair exonuclease SbcCD nuclease subunit
MGSDTEFLVFSDLHAHPFPYGAVQKTFSGVNGRYASYNSRLLDAMAAMDEVRQYGVKHNIKRVLFGGDLFHKPDNIPTQALEVITFEICRFMDEGFELFMIPGNHDTYDKAGLITSLNYLETMSNNITVGLGHPTTFSFKNNASLLIVGVPYIHDISKAREVLTAAAVTAERFKAQQPKAKVVLLAHAGMQGAKVGSDFVLVSPNDPSVQDIKHEAFDLCLFGHYHKHQKLFDNGWFIGATLQHNWSDAKDWRGFLHVDLSKPIDRCIKKVETHIPSKFYNFIDTGITYEEPRDKDFVKVITDTSRADVEKRCNARKIEIISASDANIGDVALPENLFNPKKLIEEWAKMKNPEASEELIKLGKELFTEASK